MVVGFQHKEGTAGKVVEGDEARPRVFRPAVPIYPVKQTGQGQVLKPIILKH